MFDSHLKTAVGETVRVAREIAFDAISGKCQFEDKG